MPDHPHSPQRRPASLLDVDSVSHSRDGFVVYAGIGAHRTPVSVLTLMRELDAALAQRGWVLRSGGALGKGEMTANPVNDVRKPTVKRSRAVVAVSPSQVERVRTLLLEGYVEIRARGDGTLRHVQHPPDPISAMLVSLLVFIR